MEEKQSKVRKILSYLTQDHRRLLDLANGLEKDLEENFSDEVIEKIIQFIDEDVEKHSKIEEIDLDEALREARIDFDIEALNFGHQTLNDIADHFKYLVELYKKGESKYLNRDLRSEIVKTFKEYSQTLKDHFIEEENFFFPDILKYDLERFE
jgi:hemerythrin-like domain-containing protein